MPLIARASLVSLAGALGLAGVASPARADDKAACVAASDQAQTLRDEGKYQAARAAMVSCGRDSCPAIVRHDCDKWLTELDAAQPTLVLGARDPHGNDMPGTRVMLDGVALEEHLDGKPVAVDPGEHLLRYEAPGAAPVEQRVIVRVNEKNRMLTAVLMPERTAPPPASPVVPAPDVTPHETDSSGSAPVPVASWVFLGLAVVGAGGFAGFGLSGQHDVNDMRAAGGCAPNCAESQVDSAKTKLLVADISLGVGVVSLGAAALFFFRRDHEPSAHAASAAPKPGLLAPTLDFQARQGGGLATLSARF